MEIFSTFFPFPKFVICHRVLLLRWISHIFLILLYFTFFSSSKSETDSDTTKRQGRGFCNDSYGVFCMLYNALSGKAGDKAADR